MDQNVYLTQEKVNRNFLGLTAEVVKNIGIEIVKMFWLREKTNVNKSPDS